MAITNLAPGDTRSRTSSVVAASLDGGEAHSSAVSWGAIFAGAAGAAALSLILLILGTGLGLSSVSPWSNQGANATAVGLSTILWLTFTQLAAAGMGGYLAGRLRTKWSAASADEVYFRDTAHGFLAWSVATLATAAMLTSAVGSILGGGLQAGASVASGIGTAATGAATAAAGGAASRMGSADMGSGYFLDSLFRRDPNAAGTGSAPASPAQQPGGDTASSGAQPAPGTSSPPSPGGAEGAPGSSAGSTAGGSAGSTAGGSAGSTAEIGRIFMNSIGSGALPADDAKYVGQMVARNTGLSQQDAEKRVTDTYGRMQQKLRDSENAAREAADKARKGSAYTAVWLFISMLIGAFVASWAATFGGRRRDLL